MRKVASVRDVAWAPRPNVCDMVVASRLPPLALTSSAFALAFDGDHLLLIRVARRGWDIPGGHRESDESPEAAMRREVHEEARARLEDVTLFGYQRIRLLGAKPGGYQYPFPESYQVFYRARVAALDPFVATDEVRERALVSPTAARAMLHIRDHRPLYEVALASITNRPDDAIITEREQ